MHHAFEPGRHRSFHHYSQAWYFEASNIDPNCIDAVNIVMGSEDDCGCDYEFKIEWRDIGHPGPHPRVQVFNDGWLAFAECADLFAWLSRRSGETTPEDVCSALVSMGFVDRTEKVQRPPWRECDPTPVVESP